ncbi:hypothetical protein H7683_19920 [Ectopseudomonas mendocina]|uniref:hypothetical protein n=1 Tax=Ectopseudomonas mendocina TaxID=300 RepID=UPI001ADF57A9|nr:hypothetical protein [Pseudomonas mendocina]QTN45229.1 hypothetical protein H7683_19920 [Pseudomonas mendocina]
MLKISVVRPVKRDESYVFSAAVGSGQVVSFGFHSMNFKIQHHELWDSIYPLMFLIRNGGPIFSQVPDGSRVVISFEYPVLHKVAEFYIARAAMMGYKLEVDAQLYDGVFDLKSSGHVLAFGGGKDSRLLYGLLRELGQEPQVYVAGHGFAPDIPRAYEVKPVNGSMPDRLMPGLMSAPRFYYHGSGFGEIHQSTPWHQYYDISSPYALLGFSSLLKSLGLYIDFDPAVCVLPYNLIQKILYLRYPELYAYQKSTSPGIMSEKNLHVALLKRYHGICHQAHLSLSAFQKLSEKFINMQQSSGDAAFGFRRHREVINREMRSILAFLAPSDNFLSALVPLSWREEWIDYIHDYAYPWLGGKYLEIFSQYAPVAPAAFRIFDKFKVS